MRYVPWVALSLCMALSIACAQDDRRIIAIDRLQTDYRLTGKLGHPVAQALVVQGIVLNGYPKSRDSGPVLRIQRIEGQATQKDLVIGLTPFFGEFGEAHSIRKTNLPALKFGSTYEFEGYESFTFEGAAPEAMRSLEIIPQVPGFGRGFSHFFVVYKGKEIEPVQWGPADFVDREALLSGVATSWKRSAYLTGDGWRLVVDSRASWPAHMENKLVECRGVIRTRANPTEYVMENGTSRLVLLGDQLGRPVILRGRVYAVKGKGWWLDYRRTNVYVENLEQTPGWTSDFAGRPTEISGVLDETMLRDTAQPGSARDAPLRKQFVLRKPSWRLIDALLTPEIPDR